MDQKGCGLCLGLAIGTASFWGLLLGVFLKLARLFGLADPDKYIGPSNWLIGLSVGLLVLTVAVIVIGLSRDEEA